MKRIIPYGRHTIEEDDISEVIKVLKSSFITQGPKIGEFEELIASTVGARYCVIFSSGTAALHAAYFAAGLEKDDELITSPITFVATTNACLHLGGHPVFVDIEPDTGNLNTSLLEEKVNSRTKLIVPVHYGGHPVDMEKVAMIAEKHNIMVIEDACHALGAMYKGSMIGSCLYSHMTVFSFHPVKHITTGEGGAVTTNSEKLFKRLLLFRNNGIAKKSPESLEGPWYYEVHCLGLNYRMTDIQAALGISQIKKLHRFVDRRRNIAESYKERFSGNKYFHLPVEREYAFSSFHLYPVRLKGPHISKKKELFSLLKYRGIDLQVHYIPVYLHPFYRKLGYNEGLCPVSEEFYKRVFTLPIFPAMDEEDIDLVERNILEVFNEIS